MPACSPTPYLSPLAHAAARKRLSAALAASALVHVWLAGGLTGGSPPYRGQSASPWLDVQLEHVPAPRIPVAAEPSPEDAGQLHRPPAALASTPKASRSPAAASQPSPSHAPSAQSGTVAETPDPTYYAARELDVYPALAVPLELTYSRRARDAGIAGRARLLLRIDEHGVVQEVAIVEAYPPGYFEGDAQRAFSAVRFTPGRKNGRAVKSSVLVEVSYGVSAAR